MMRYFIVLIILAGLVSCDQSEKNSTKNQRSNDKTVNEQKSTKNNPSVKKIDDELDIRTIQLALMNKDSVRKARKALLDSLMKNPKHQSNLQNAKSKTTKAIELFEASDLPGAIDQFKQALLKDPENSRINYYIGMIYYDMGQYDLSMSYYKDAVRFDPIDSLSLLGIGQNYFIKNELKKANVFYDLAIQAGPGYPTAYYNRGTILGMQKKYNEALNDLNMAIKLDPGYAAAYANRGNAYYMLKQREQACNNWKKAAELGDQNGQTALETHCK
jgi:tetratricopeptide (TPR) repeat protein